MSVSRYPWLAWRPTLTGYWEREIDEAEQFYTFLTKTYEGTGQLYFAITGFVTLAVEVTESSPLETGFKIEKAFRQAWLRL